MKAIPVLLTLCLFSGCATLDKLARRDGKQIVPERTIPSSPRRSAKVRTDEKVKAYPVGRYSEPDLPEVMHERHTIYRVEQSPDWNYLPDDPYALPLGPIVAESTPSSSYYLKSDAEMLDGQQRAQIDALREQNQALQKRIESLNRDQSGNEKLQAEIERLKAELDSLPSLEPPAASSTPPEPPAQPWSDFSNTN